MQRTLKSSELKRAALQLVRIDPALGDVLERLGTPPLWKRPVTFATLVHVLLEQQVSIVSAMATFKRLEVACEGRVTATRVADLGQEAMRGLGFTRQKSRYAAALAADVGARRFQIGRLRHLADDQVRTEITQRLGFGNWSADVFLLLALARPDVIPLGDLALVKGMHELDGGNYESTEELLARAEVWRPYRGVATRMIWQLYLANRNRLDQMPV
ncbi:DNA-3-methyladenine glycosylase 2 family protein [bacterium]|nr:DNA-3-methyladenine glycosylase 2 family protein [bacterium]